MNISIGIVLLAVLPAVVTGGGMWFIFARNIKEQREIEERRRQVEIKSEPLIKLRNQIASMSSYMKICLSVKQVQEMQKRIPSQRSRPPEEAKNSVKLACGRERFLAEAGDYFKALYQVDDKEITREAEQAMGKLIDASTKHGGDLMTEHFEEAQQAILHIQSLINERLGEIGRKNGISK